MDYISAVLRNHVYDVQCDVEQCINRLLIESDALDYDSPEELWKSMRYLCKSTAEVINNPNINALRANTMLTNFGDIVITLAKNLRHISSATGCDSAEGYFYRQITADTSGVKQGSNKITLIESEKEIVGIVKYREDLTVLGLEDLPEVGILKGGISSFSSECLGEVLTKNIAPKAPRTPIVKLQTLMELDSPLDPLRMTTFALDSHILEDFKQGLTATNTGKRLASIDDMATAARNLAKSSVIIQPEVFDEFSSIFDKHA